jgi:HEPN superfamily RiboL-PSP-like protein
MSALLSKHLEAAAEQIASMKFDLARADVAGIAHNPVKRDEAAKVKAASYVFLSACLENFVRSSLESILVEISLQKVPLSQIRSSLFSLACHTTFQSISDSRRERAWTLRTELFRTLFDTSTIFLSDYELPLDKRTLSLAHFQNIWSVFGFRGHSLPSPLHVAALEELRTGRNNVAHGHTDPITFGRSKAIHDVSRLVQRIEDVIEYLIIEAEDYLTRKGYLRSTAGE